MNGARRGLAVLACAAWSAAAGAGPACEPRPAALAQMPRAHISLESPPAPVRQLAVSVAATAELRAAGFQHVCARDVSGYAILFVYPGDTRGRFHMRNVHAALDIAFADAEGRILEIQRMQPGAAGAPGAPLYYQPRQPFRFALEVPAGAFDRDGVKAGQARLDWPGRPAAPGP